MPLDFRFARRLDRIEMSGIRRIFDLVEKMPDAVNLSLGQAHFDVPQPVKDAAKRAIDEGHNRYTVTQGIPELRQALVGHVERRHGVRPEATLVTNGAAGALFLAMSCLVDEGDEVLIPDPYFVLYCHLVNLLRGKPVLIDTYPQFRLTVDRLEAAVTPRTKILLINSPVNPTGVAYTRQEMAAFGEFARRRDLIVISDEIYDTFTYDFSHEGMAKHCPERTIVASAFSKSHAMPGWRLGYAYGPAPVIERMGIFQQSTYVCANSVAQRAALAAIDTDVSACTAEYRKKRDRVVEGLRDRFEIVRPQGAFYIFPKAPWGTDEEFVRAAIENKVLVVPGRAASSRQTHFRVSFAASDRDLDRGIEILNKIARR